jgi:hypothetical protein
MNDRKKRVIREPAAVAFTLHAGRAVTVVLTGTRRDPQMILRHEIDLADPWVKESRHPYHQALGARSPDGERALRRGCRAARASAGREMRNLVRGMKSHGFDPRGAAIVVSSVADPARVASAHARAHAEEAKLYRDVVEQTLVTSGLDVKIHLDATLRPAVAKQLDRVAVDVMLKSFARAVGTPWRAAEKHASLAAWLVLPR